VTNFDNEETERLKGFKEAAQKEKWRRDDEIEMAELQKVANELSELIAEKA
jgi:hypothetical protein